MTEAPAWAKGFDLDFLKEAAALYKAEFKPHTYGAFGLPKERDVADARAEGNLIWTRGHAAPFDLEAAAIFRPVRQPTSHKDFAGREATMLQGDVFIRSIAGSADGKRRLIMALEDRAGGPAMWVEGHVENRELDELLEALEFKRVMTKVSASSDLKGLWLKAGNHRGRAPGPLHPSDSPGVKVLREAFLEPGELEIIRGELDAWVDAHEGAFAQHYSGYNKRQSWTAFALRGYVRDDPSFIIKPAEMSKAWKKEHPELEGVPCSGTIAEKAFPGTWEILSRIPVPFYQRVRFMRLSAAGGELTRHADITDPEAGTLDGQIARLHIPISTRPECVFRSWRLDGEEVRLHMPEGSLSYIDTRKPHAVINPADVERIHLVVDAFSSPRLREWIAG